MLTLLVNKVYDGRKAEWVRPMDEPSMVIHSIDKEVRQSARAYPLGPVIVNKEKLHDDTWYNDKEFLSTLRKLTRVYFAASGLDELYIYGYAVDEPKINTETLDQEVNVYLRAVHPPKAEDVVEDEKVYEPNQKKEPDLTALRKVLQMHIDSMTSGEYHEDNDDKHYIYEEACKAIFGDDIFDWIKENT